MKEFRYEGLRVDDYGDGVEEDDIEYDKGGYRTLKRLEDIVRRRAEGEWKAQGNVDAKTQTPG